MDFQGFSNGFQSISNGFPRLFPWISKALPMDFQCFFNDFPMDFQGFSNGFPRLLKAFQPLKRPLQDFERPLKYIRPLMLKAFKRLFKGL
jgi:hypothetical protein